MHTRLLALCGLLLSVAVPAHAQSDQLAMLDGTWAVVTVAPQSQQLQHITFSKVGFGQRAASLPFLGQAAISLSNGRAGSNLRVSGPGFDCYYLVVVVDSYKPQEMHWQLKSGKALCLESMILRKARP